jgi:hypothetical protein
VEGVTPRRQAAFVEKGARRSLQVVVLVRKGVHPNIVIPLLSEEAGEGAEGGAVNNNTKSPSLNGERYVRIIEQKLLRGRFAVSGRSTSRRQGPVRLVHDRATPHTSRVFSEFAARNGMETVVLPTKAADLDPLDYGVFGGVKTRWLRQVEAGNLGWEDQCKVLIQQLEEANADAAIAMLPKRIKMCIKAKGSHFE